jgi:hypothetical protein
MQLSPRTAITFVPNMPPIRTTLPRYYEEKNLGQSGILTRARLAVATLAASIVFFVMSAGAAAMLTHEMNAASETTQHFTTRPFNAAPAYERR